ncbi:MAG: galactose-1-phosphate uridylyltransferase [Noviherbaspirillum sp.]
MDHDHRQQAAPGEAQFTLELTKPDGRAMTLYGCGGPVRLDGPVPSPFPDALHANPHLRWHPLRGEWIAYAAYRQGRTFLPPPQYNPLAVCVDPANPTELPAGDYAIAVFENRFPSLSMQAHDPPAALVDSAPGKGLCEVVVFTTNPAATLGTLPLAQIELLLQVWGDRTARAGSRGDIEYVLPFENRGAEVGVTLHHPHGQIYGYPFVPPIPARMQAMQQAFYAEHRKSLLADLVQKHMKAGENMLYQGRHAVAFVPACARYPYEVWVSTIEPVAYFSDLSADQRADLARALKTVLLKYDGLWQRPFPYLMAWYQAPTDGRKHPEAFLHAEFLPPYRTRDRLKYLAGTELGAGMFAMDALPEEKARELQQVEARLE